MVPDGGRVLVPHSSSVSPPMRIGAASEGTWGLEGASDVREVDPR
jgi:hypothetical protein